MRVFIDFVRLNNPTMRVFLLIPFFENKKPSNHAVFGHFGRLGNERTTGGIDF